MSKEFECVYPMRKDSNAPPNVLQEYLNLVDWKGLELPSTERRCKLEASVKKFECSPTVLVEWIELKKTIAKFQAEICKETSDDKGSDDMTSKAESGFVLSKSGSVLSKTTIFPKKQGRKREISNESARSSSLRKANV